MGCALQNLRNHDEALLAFKMAVLQNYQPLGEVWYRIAEIYSVKKNVNEAVNALEFAFKNDFPSKLKILRDASLDDIRNSPVFDQLMKKHLKEWEAQISNFMLFESNFQKSQFPFHITDAKTAYNTKNKIPSKFQDFVPGMDYASFGRDISLEYSYVASLYKTDTFTLLSYVSYPDVNEDSLAPSTVYLATYNTYGSLIENFEFAKRDYPDSTMSGLIRYDLSIELQTTKNTWKDNAYKYGGYIKSNLENTEQSTYYYRIDRLGHFIKLKELPAQPKQADQKLGLLHQ